MRKPQDRNHAEQQEKVEALLIEGLDSGPSTTMTPEDWDEIEREGGRLAAQRRSSPRSRRPPEKPE
jgi:hypothetical protein